MNLINRLLPLLIALYVSAGARCAPPDSLPAEIDGIVADLSKISGLAQLHKIEYARITKDQVKQVLEQLVKENVKPEEIRAEELTLKKFGFAPADFDLKKTTVDLLSEQAAAFYDYRKKKLFVIDSMPGYVQKVALVHEVAHALADQHFHLEKFIQHGGQQDDSSLARMAVMEGQATWLMMEQMVQSSGGSIKNSPALLKLMNGAAALASGQFPVFDRAPLYLRETLLFPYTQGLLFQNAVIQKEDLAAFAEVFRNPPVSTQQILHPEMYFAGTRPVEVPLPKLHNRRGWRSLSAGQVGELDHAILLRQFAGEKESAEVSPHWKGGGYRLLENKTDRRLVLAYASEWDSAEAARKFFGLYQRVLKGKWKTFQVDSETANTVAGRGDDGYFLLRLDGPRVSSLEGAAAPPSVNAIH